MAQIFLQRLCCDKTTENGEDEIYILIGGKHSNGTTFNYRLPDNNRHWDMNDGRNDHNHCISNIQLTSFELAEGESVEFVIFIMEEDGGMSRPYSDLIAGVLSSTGNPYAVAAGTVIGIVGQFLNFSDSDDWIGTFSVKITRVSGHISTDWRAVDRVSGVIQGIHGPNTCEFRMNGDGSNYVGWYHVN